MKMYNPSHEEMQTSLVFVHTGNQAAISIYISDQVCAKRKHSKVKYYHVRDYIKKGDIRIQYVPSKLQRADVLTKPLDTEAMAAHVHCLLN